MKKLIAFFLLSVVLVGCGASKRTSIDGYNDEMLARKRVFVVMTQPEKVMIKSPAAYAYSRGVAEAGAREMLVDEFNAKLIPAIDARLDSNTVLPYDRQPVAAIVPLSATEDFIASGGPIDWDKVARAGREGNIDYMIVVRDFAIDNTMPDSDEEGRGEEMVTAHFSLLDVQRKKLMTSGEVEFSVDSPRTPEMTYEKFAEEIARQMPFWVE